MEELLHVKREDKWRPSEDDKVWRSYRWGRDGELLVEIYMFDVNWGMMLILDGHSKEVVQGYEVGEAIFSLILSAERSVKNGIISKLGLSDEGG